MESGKYRCHLYFSLRTQERKICTAQKWTASRTHMGTERDVTLEHRAEDAVEANQEFITVRNLQLMTHLSHNHGDKLRQLDRDACGMCGAIRS